MHCIATPNVGIGDHTTGTTMYSKWSRELDSVRKQILLKKEHICALSEQFDSITCSRKKAEGKLIRLEQESDTLENMKNLTGSFLSPNEKLTVNVASSGVTINTNNVNNSKTTGTDNVHVEGAFASGFYLPKDCD